MCSKKEIIVFSILCLGKRFIFTVYHYNIRKDVVFERNQIPLLIKMEWSIIKYFSYPSFTSLLIEPCSKPYWKRKLCSISIIFNSMSFLIQKYFWFSLRFHSRRCLAGQVLNDRVQTFDSTKNISNFLNRAIRLFLERLSLYLRIGKFLKAHVSVDRNVYIISFERGRRWRKQNILNVIGLNSWQNSGVCKTELKQALCQLTK